MKVNDNDTLLIYSKVSIDLMIMRNGRLKFEETIWRGNVIRVEHDSAAYYARYHFRRINSRIFDKFLEDK